MTAKEKTMEICHGSLKEQYLKSKYKNSTIFKFVLKTDNIRNYKMRSIVNKNERTPSGFIYYNDRLKDYYYKDFSADLHLDAVEFSKLYYGPEKYLDILFKNINELDEIEKENTDRKIQGYIESVYNRVKESENKENIFKYITTDIPYFRNFLKIDEDITNKYRVVRDIRYNHTYYYIDLNGSVVQRYRPFEDKQYKFKTFMKGNYAYGIRHYRQCFKHLLITGSIKDMMSSIMILRNMLKDKSEYIMPVAMLSEREVNVKEDIENKILFATGFKASFEKLYIAYDNDEHGIRNAENIRKINEKYIEVDNLIMSLCSKFNVKDATDLWIKIRNQYL